MSIFRAGLSGLFLALANIASVIAAFGLYHFFKPANQILFQAPIAAALSIIAFVAWCIFVNRISFRNLLLQKNSHLLGTFLLAFLWIPAIFVPVHFVTQGYTTAFSNIVAIWLFQLPTNLLAIFFYKQMSKFTKQTSNGTDLFIKGP